MPMKVPPELARTHLLGAMVAEKFDMLRRGYHWWEGLAIFLLLGHSQKFDDGRLQGLGYLPCLTITTTTTTITITSTSVTGGTGVGVAAGVDLATRASRSWLGRTAAAASRTSSRAVIVAGTGTAAEHLDAALSLCSTRR